MLPAKKRCMIGKVLVVTNYLRSAFYALPLNLNFSLYQLKLLQNDATPHRCQIKGNLSKQAEEFFAGNALVFFNKNTCNSQFL